MSQKMTESSAVAVIAVSPRGQRTMLGLRRFWSQSIRFTCRTRICQEWALSIKRWPHQPERKRVPSTQNPLIRKIERTIRIELCRVENNSTLEIIRTVRDLGACDQAYPVRSR